ncbi:MAG: hypothetical protein J0H68_09935 [Sphingobacteriia bacterium]|nr:hypothetical protein [Sphingobacteriia bacterium]
MNFLVEIDGKMYIPGNGINTNGYNIIILDEAKAIIDDLENIIKNIKARKNEFQKLIYNSIGKMLYHFNLKLEINEIGELIVIEKNSNVEINFIY